MKVWLITASVFSIFSCVREMPPEKLGASQEAEKSCAGLFHSHEH